MYFLLLVIALSTKGKGPRCSEGGFRPRRLRQKKDNRTDWIDKWEVPVASFAIVTLCIGDAESGRSRTVSSGTAWIYVSPGKANHISGIVH